MQKDNKGLHEDYNENNLSILFKGRYIKGLYIICISVQLVIMVSLSQCSVSNKQPQNAARSEYTWKGRTILAKVFVWILTSIAVY
jgi:uncharacterized membrane protein